MIRNKLYDELEKEGYSFYRAGYNGQFSPEVFNIENTDDWAAINLSVVINGQYQIEHGSAVTKRTLELLQKVVEEISKPDYSDFYSKALFEDDE